MVLKKCVVCGREFDVCGKDTTCGEKCLKINQVWEERIQRIYQPLEELSIKYYRDYKYLYNGNSFNNPSSQGLNYGDYDYSDHPEERAWYWKVWWYDL